MRGLYVYRVFPYPCGGKNIRLLLLVKKRKREEISTCVIKGKPHPFHPNGLAEMQAMFRKLQRECNIKRGRSGRKLHLWMDEWLVDWLVFEGPVIIYPTRTHTYHI